MDLKIDITSVYRGKKQILRDINAEIQKGSFTAVIGRNGCGKSTLLLAIAGIIPYTGSVTLGKSDLRDMTSRERAKLVAVMLQHTSTPHITVSELVSLGRSPYAGNFARLGEHDNEIIENAICDAELCDVRNCFVDRISGGEVRRSYLGMALAQDTPLLLLDEATAFMDVDREMRFLDMIEKKRLDSRKTVISVMHDLSAAIKYADNVLLIDNGTAAFFGTVEELLSTDLVEKTFSVKRFIVDTNGKKRIFFST